MNLGNLLVAKGLVSVEDIQQAVNHQTTNGGRLGDSIVALGLMTKGQIEEVLTDAPQAPSMAQTTGIDPVFLVELAIKGMCTEKLETISQLVNALKLSSTIINQLLQLATERKLVEALAASTGNGLRAEMRYGLTRAGREYAVDATGRGQYFGPTPMSLEDYKERILRQRVTNKIVTRQRLNEAFDGLVMPEDILNRWIVPLNSRVDYLTLHTGKSAMIPFDEIVIFSTNMHPDDLMDPAFQRRISYQLETVEPPEELFCEVFIGMAKKNGPALTEELYKRVLNGIRENAPPGILPAQVHRRAGPRVMQVRGDNAAVHAGERRRCSREPVRREGR